ncbi:hypothetical protein BaRGS_00028919 [Batillaria attramentaria]|uniref:Uncharacterized protein n=1 Tax=Batillaria attramentaria TaxID=370345 RepID=A0ABD0JXW5_9CAEN
MICYKVRHVLCPTLSVYKYFLSSVCSLESRDNPFLPGGDLSKEAEELLKKATIVRDKFYLDDQGRQQPIIDGGDHNSPRNAKEQTSHDVDGALPNATSSHANAGVVEERISPTAASKAAAAPGVAPHPRENGKAGDAGTSPDSVKLDVGGSPTADGARAGGSDSAGGGGGGDQQDKDKAKRRPKCCVVM